MQQVLVTGGSGGIGAALCRRLATAGYRPLVGYAGNRGAAEAIANSTGGIAVKLDLADDDDIDAVVAIAGGAESMAGVVLAGSVPPRIAPLADVQPDEMAQAWRVNVGGPQRLLAGLIGKVFRPLRQGIVVGILSQAMGGGQGKVMSGLGAYTVAKYGMAGLLAVVAADYPWLKVRTVSPGFTETNMLQAFDQRFLELMRTRTPFTQPDEVAAEIMQAFEADPASKLDRQ